MWALPELRSERQAQRLPTVMLLVKVVQLTSYVEEVQMWLLTHTVSQAVSTGWLHLLMGPGEPCIHPALSEVPQGWCGKPQLLVSLGHGCTLGAEACLGPQAGDGAGFFPAHRGSH